MKNWKIKENCTLEDALDYENDEVTHRFQESFPSLSPEEVSLIFEETKKWLWLGYKIRFIKSKDSEAAIPSPAVYEELLLIDEMWHTFLLYTKDYMDYCYNKFGIYIHHQPTSYKQKAQSQTEYQQDPDKLIQEVVADKKEQFSLIYDHLGEETLLLWYEKMPEKFEKELHQIMTA
ncbi:MAG TPA: hypothetical protein DCS93_03270 [Microscillaceae bacterium]|nr:hypothetical protein [Microscillaceae bacterium]